MGKKKERSKPKKKASGGSPNFQNDQLGENSGEARMEKKKHQ